MRKISFSLNSNAEIFLERRRRMTYQDVIDKKFTYVAFAYSDRVLIVRTTSVKADDFLNKEFSHIIKDKLPFFKLKRDVLVDTIDIGII